MTGSKIEIKIGVGKYAGALTTGQRQHYSVASLTPDRRGLEQLEPWQKKMTIS